MNTNLFGEPYDERDLPLPTTSTREKKTGHAWKPGTGPAGETCKTCHHYAIRSMAGTYRKCKLMRAHWTRGPGTDIRARDPACKFWEKDRGE